MEETHDSRRSAPLVTILGAGTMGSAMARRLVSCGFPVRVWNRSPDALRPLAESGAQTFPHAPEAVRGAKVVLTLLPTADIVSAVMVGSEVLDSMDRGQAWAQMGTIGVEGTRQLAERSRSQRPDIFFVDAPVSGSRVPAENGQLLILASGPDEAKAVVGPVFDALGHRTLWLGPAGRGSQMKLVLNTWLAFEVEAAAEAMSLATQWGIGVETLDTAIDESPLVSSYAASKLKKMQSGDDRADFALGMALKDLNLVREAVGPIHAPIACAIAERWHNLAVQGLGHLDVSGARLNLE